MIILYVMTTEMAIVLTGGHLTPALAVIDELLARGRWKIAYFGRQYATEGAHSQSIERSAVEKKGVLFIPLAAGRLQRRFTRYTIPALLRIPVGFFQALIKLHQIKPAVILSFGSYVSVPVVVAGWLLRIPIITHEQTLVQGLANRISTSFSTKIAISWLQTQSLFPKNKTVLTGNPLRQSVFIISEQFWNSLGFSEDLPLVFVTGGNQGSHAINQAVKEVLPSLLEKANVFHQCGQSDYFDDYQTLVKEKDNLPEKLRRRYCLEKYLHEEKMGTLLNKASLVIGRSGANTVSELAALGKAALLIPYPWLYRDEQTQNARILESVGSAQILKQSDLDGKILLSEILGMLKDISMYQQFAIEAKKLVNLDAGQRIVDLVEEVALASKT